MNTIVIGAIPNRITKNEAAGENVGRAHWWTGGSKLELKPVSINFLLSFLLTWPMFLVSLDQALSSDVSFPERFYPVIYLRYTQSWQV